MLYLDLVVPTTYMNGGKMVEEMYTSILHHMNPVFDLDLCCCLCSMAKRRPLIFYQGFNIALLLHL